MPAPKPIALPAILLVLFAAAGTALVAITYEQTGERIQQNERAALLQQLHALIPDTMHDNDLLADTIQVRDPELLGTEEPLTVFRARQGDHAVAVALTPIAPDGYNGTIRLLVAIQRDGSLAGVRVISHRETPGLGDGIEEDRSPWIYQFTGTSLRYPVEEQWKVRRDGGHFDQLTGATITPRAIVGAVHRALIYFSANRDRLLAPPVPEQQDAIPGTDS